MQQCVVVVEGEHPHAGHVHHAPQALLTGQQGFFGVLARGDVKHRDDHPVDAVSRRAVGQQPHHKRPLVGSGHLPFQGRELFQDRFGVSQQLGVFEPVGNVRNRAAVVGGNQVKNLLGRRGVEPDAEGAVEEDGGDPGGVNQVLQVVAGNAYLLDFDLQLLVDRAQLLVDGLQLLLAGFQLFGGRAQLFVDGLHLLVRRLELFGLVLVLLRRLP